MAILVLYWRLNKAEVITKKFVTPFDYSNQALIYEPETMIEPNKNNTDYYLEKCLEHIQKLITLTEGRSLILTTAKGTYEHYINRFNKFFE